jgi:hypothetical protein
MPSIFLSKDLRSIEIRTPFVTVALNIADSPARRLNACA